MDENENKSYFMLVCYTFFSVCMFLIFVLPIIKLDVSGLRSSYNVYEFVKTFANINSLSQQARSLLNCCYALFVIGGIAILISIYSVIVSLENREQHLSLLMCFICIAVAIVSIVIIVTINAAGNDFIGANTPDLNDTIFVGDTPSMQPLKYIFKVGACPIFLISISVFLVISHCVGYFAENANSAPPPKGTDTVEKNWSPANTEKKSSLDE